MAPTVQFLDPDVRGTREMGIETEFIAEQVGLVANTSGPGDAEQGIVASHMPSLDDGRRRSLRLRGKSAQNNAGPGDVTPAIIKEVQPSGRKGRRKKSTLLESMHSNGGLVVEPQSDEKVEAYELEAALKTEVAGAGGGATMGCGALPGEPLQQEEVAGEEKAVKVKRLEDLGGLDEALCEVRGDAGITVSPVDNASDFCDSNIYENLHNILILNLKETAIQSDMLGSSGGDRGVGHGTQVVDLSEVEVKMEAIHDDTGHLVLHAGIGGPYEAPDVGMTPLSNAQAGCEPLLQVSEKVEVEDGKLVDSGVKEDAGFGDSNDSTSKPRECTKDGLKSYADPEEDSSSVTSRDDATHRACSGDDKNNKGTSGDKVTGSPEAVCKIPETGVIPVEAMNTELLIEGTSQVRLSEGNSEHPEEPHGEVGHVGNSNTPDAKSLRNLRGKNRTSVVGSQVVGKGNVGDQMVSLSTLEGGQTSQATVGSSGCARTGKGKRKQVCAGEVLVDDELAHIGEDKVQALDATVDASPNKKCRNVVDGAAAVSANSPGMKTGFSRESNAEAREFEMAESSPAKDKQGSGKIDCTLGEGEGSTQPVKNGPVESVNQGTGGLGGDIHGTVKVESSNGAMGSLATHTGSIPVGEDDSSGVTEGEANTTREKVDESVGITSRAGWVRCDDCDKWRSIPVELAEQIEETNAYWSCRQNPNKEFADCSISQVKSNEEINRELGISESSLCDEGDDADATGDSRPMDDATQENGQAVWTLIRRNIFKHRGRKHQDVDEAMVCQCILPKDGEQACGEDCLNRMLNVECLAQQCPCGSACTNQQFQKRAYAKVELFRCGKKGHGLRAMENIPRGTFIIEYVGEVLDMPSFEVRQEEYAVNSQKHFYFMTLSANEVIDACSKGNFGRFINHSCEPNCQTEKWMVDGEVCIGLFAIRDLKEGEEITFDYNFVRGGGSVAKKCECGAANCRGFIGVDPDTPHTVVEIESEDGEDPDPVMLQAESDEEFDHGPAKKAPVLTDGDVMDENGLDLEEGLKRKFYSGGAKDMKNPRRVKRVKTSAKSKMSSHGLAQPRGYAGATRVAGHRAGVRSNYQSEVEEKLGELSYQFGGLKNRKDTAKQYLKLLVLTAASGVTINGAAACSVRDLSMLLEALLKTEKLGVLKDIMNKNGLQMFHNLLKQFRKLFEKRPILRKLLKVLDHLAKHKVLTVEHIYCPPRSGMECFSDTLFELTRHDDLEVQNMARNFRRLYVPPRPHRTDSNADGNHVKSPSPMRLQSCDQVLKKPTDQLQPSPSGDLLTVQTDRSMVQSAPQQTTPISISQQASGVVTKLPSVNSSAQKLTEQEGQATGGQAPSTAAEGNLANPPVTTRRKRPSRWDTVKDPDAAAVLTDALNAVQMSSKNATASQPGLASSLTPSSEHHLKRDPLQSSQSPKPEAAPNQQRGPPEKEKLAVASTGPPPATPSASHAGGSLPPGRSATKPSACPVPSGMPRRPVGPPPHGQPFMHPPMLVQQGACPPRHPMFQPGHMPAGGMPGPRPMVHPGPMHIGMQGAPMGNGMAFTGGQMPNPNMFPGVPGLPPPPMQGGPPRMPMPGAHPPAFGFPPGHPAQGVPQPPTLMHGAPYAPWQMMQHPGEAPPMFAGNLPRVPPPPPPPLPQRPPAWGPNGAPRMEVFPRAPPPPLFAGREAPPEAGNGQGKQAVSASQRRGTGTVDVKPGESEAAAEPPVPGLSPVRAPSGLTTPQKPTEGITLLECSQGPNGDVGRGGGPVLPALTIVDTCMAIPQTEPGSGGPGRRAQPAATHGDQCEDEWNGLHHPFNVPEKRGSMPHAYSHLGESKGRQGSGESEVGGSIVAWDTPECSSFHHHVSAMVRSRVESKNMIHFKDVEKFCSKLTEVVTRKETKKYQECKSQGIVKPIPRSRLLEKVEAYVDLQVEIYVEKKNGGEGRPV